MWVHMFLWTFYAQLAILYVKSQNWYKNVLMERAASALVYV